MSSDHLDSGADLRALLLGENFSLEDLRRRNPRAAALDVLLLFMTAFFAYLMSLGLWPAVIGAVPTGGLLYFGLRSSRAFLLAQVLVIALTFAVKLTGFVAI